jgi:hypothetical protein
MTTREKVWQLTAMLQWCLVTPDGKEAADAPATLEKAPGHMAGFMVDDPATMSRLVAPPVTSSRR